STSFQSASDWLLISRTLSVYPTWQRPLALPPCGASALYGKRLAASAANCVEVFRSAGSEFGINCERPAQPIRTSASTHPVSSEIRFISQLSDAARRSVE